MGAANHSTRALRGCAVAVARHAHSADKGFRSRISATENSAVKAFGKPADPYLGPRRCESAAAAGFTGSREKRMDADDAGFALRIDAVAVRNLEPRQERVDSKRHGLQNMEGDQLAFAWNALLVGCRPRHRGATCDAATLGAPTDWLD